ncbi:MAG: DUF6266 family protein [Daejeonella sp.]
MAHLHSGIMGPVSGKIGNLVYYVIKGKNFVRRAPGKCRKPPTLKQQAQRAKFGEAMRFISPIANLINESYRSMNRRHTGTNILVKEILRDAIMGKYPHFFIDYPRVSLLRGKLPWSMGSMQHEEGSCDLILTWEVITAPAHLEDELIVLIRCCTTGNWFVSKGEAQRAQGGCCMRVEAPVDSGIMQVWMAFRSPDHCRYSNSEYLGEMITNKTLSYED